MLRALLVLLSVCAYAQDPPGSSGAAFEVVSVKPSGDNSTGPNGPSHMLYGFRFSGQHVTCDEQVQDMIMYAYSVDRFQIVGPEWLDRLTYAVQAVMPTAAAKKDAPLMVRRMLAERFKLQFHREQRELPVYALLVGKGGVKLQQVEDPSKAKLLTAPNGGKANKMAWRGYYAAVALSLDKFAADMSFHFDRPVVNLTNLPGLYRIELRWVPDDSGSQYDMEMLRAVEQVGLKIENRKMSYEVLVIDRVDQTPTEN